MTSENEKLPLEDAEKAASYTDEFKASVAKATEDAAAQVAFWKEFWKEYIPGGLRKRKRYRTPGHGKRKGIRRRQSKAARIARRSNRRPKKKRRN